MSPMLSELLSAHKRAVLEMPEAATHRTFWGLAFISTDGKHCEPALDDEIAFIIPAFEDGALVDLAATSFATRQSWTRCGIGRVLGQE